MKKILIVDDIFVNRLLLKEIIKKINHQGLEAQNGKEAIEILQREKIDLILIDIEMPIMNGIETTKYIREKMPLPYKFVPIIAITAHNPADFFDDFREVGFDHLMTKPYSIEKITKILEEVEVKTR